MNLTRHQIASIRVLKACLHDDMCALLDGLIESILEPGSVMPESLSPAEQAIWREFGSHTPLVIDMKRKHPRLPAGKLLDEINKHLPNDDTTGYGEKLTDLWMDLKEVS